MKYLFTLKRKLEKEDRENKPTRIVECSREVRYATCNRFGTWIQK